MRSGQILKMQNLQPSKIHNQVLTIAMQVLTKASMGQLLIPLGCGEFRLGLG